MLGKRFDGHINLTLKTFHFSNGFSEASFPFCLPRPICAWRQTLPRSPLAQDWLRGRRNPGSTSVHYKTFAFFKVENSKALQLSVAPVADASTFGRFFKYALGTSGFVPGYANCTKCGLPSTASSRKPLEKRKRTRDVVSDTISSTRRSKLCAFLLPCRSCRSSCTASFDFGVNLFNEPLHLCVFVCICESPV